MLLKDYLTKNKITLRQFSKLCDISATKLCFILSGKKSALKKHAERIEKATNGEVSRFEVLWPEMPWDKLPLRSYRDYLEMQYD